MPPLLLPQWLCHVVAEELNFCPVRPQDLIPWLLSFPGAPLHTSAHPKMPLLFQQNSLRAAFTRTIAIQCMHRCGQGNRCSSHFHIQLLPGDGRTAIGLPHELDHGLCWELTWPPGTRYLGHHVIAHPAHYDPFYGAAACWRTHSSFLLRWIRWNSKINSIVEMVLALMHVFMTTLTCEVWWMSASRQCDGSTRSGDRCGGRLGQGTYPPFKGWGCQGWEQGNLLIFALVWPRNLPFLLFLRGERSILHSSTI